MNYESFVKQNSRFNEERVFGHLAAFQHLFIGSSLISEHISNLILSGLNGRYTRKREHVLPEELAVTLSALRPSSHSSKTIKHHGPTQTKYGDP